MIALGLGHDVTDIATFSKQLTETGSRIRNLFSVRELRQAAMSAQAKGDGEAVHLAAKWAGKEAVLKAWCEALSQHAGQTDAYPYKVDDFPWAELEILDDSHGCPRVQFASALGQRVHCSLGGVAEQDLRFHISLSHDGTIASAVVMVQCAAQPRCDDPDQVRVSS